MANAQVLCVKVKQSDYAGLFEEVWGAGSLNCAKDVDGVYEKIGRSVAAYERSAEVNPFSSKFDLFWDNATAAGKDVTKIKCGTGRRRHGRWRHGRRHGCPGGGTDPNRWSSLPQPGTRRTLSCRAWRSSTTPTGPTAPPATRSSRVPTAIRSSPTSATTTSASRRTRTTPSTPCRPPGIPTAQTGSTTAWAAYLKSAGYCCRGLRAGDGQDSRCPPCATWTCDPPRIS